MSITNLLVSNCTNINDVTDYFIFVNGQENSSAILDGALFENTNVKERTLVYFETVDSISMINSSFDNITLDPNTDLLNMDIPGYMSLDGLIFSNIISNTEDDDSNLILKIASLDLSYSETYDIKNVIVEASNIAFMTFNNIMNMNAISKTLEISNITYKDSYFSSQNSLMAFSGLQTSYNFTISLIDITFSNIKFFTTGTLIQFSQLLDNDFRLTIENIYLSDLVNCHIEYDSGNSIRHVHTSITNLTTDNIEVGYFPLFILSAYSLAEFSDSKIKNIFSYGEGSFLSVSGVNSTSIIYDSTISFNSAYNGGVFKADNQGYIQIYDTQIVENFALISGVVAIDNNGIAEFYNTNISYNSAISSSISQIFDNAFPTKFNDCTIKSNLAYSQSKVNSYISSSTN